MNKKGGHVDWVISMGIFIIYIFALFVLLRPGVKPIYRPTALLDNLEEQFNEDVIWVVKTVPLFIRKCRTSPERESPSEISVDDENGNWTLAGVKDINGESKSKTLICDIEFVFKKNENYFPFYFYFYESLEGIPNFMVKCVPDDPDYCNAELGIVGNIRGLNYEVLSSLDYAELKSEWGIPQEKEFSIYVDEIDGSTYDYNIESVKPSEQANVFVRRIDNQIVNENGYTVPVVVYLRVW